MWRIALALLVAAALALGCFYILGLWPFDAEASQAQNISLPTAPLFIEAAEVVNVPAAVSRRITKSAATGLLPDPITVFETTINLVEEQDVSSRVESGQLSDFFVRLGQKVQPYQELARLDNRLAVAAATKQSYIASSDAKLQSAKDTYQAAEKISVSGRKAPLAEREKMVDELNARRALHEWVLAYEEQNVAKLELVRIQEEVENHRIVSRIGGEIVRIYKNPGEPIRQGEVLFHIVNFDRLRAEGATSVEQRGRVQVGMRASLEPEVEKPTIKKLSGHTGAIHALAVTPDGRFLASASEDATVAIWDLHFGIRQEVLHDDQLSEVTAVACGPVTTDEDSRTTTYLFLAGRKDGSAQLWRLQVLADGQSRKDKVDLGGGTYAHRGAVRSVAIGPKGDRCATGGEDRQICLWQVSDGKLLYRVAGDKEGKGTAHRGTVTTLHFTPDDQLVSAATDKSLKKWRLGAERADLMLRQLGRLGDVEQLGVSADGKRVLFDFGDELRVLNLDNFDILSTIQSHRSGHFQRMALMSPSGRTVLTTTATGRLQLLTTPAASAPVHPAEVDEVSFFRGGYTKGFRRNSLLALAALTANLTPSGQALFPAIAGTAAPQPTRPQAPQMTPVLPAVVMAAPQAFPLWFIAPHDFRGLTAVPLLWPLNSYEIRHFVTPEASMVTCGAFSPDEKTVFTAGTDKVIRVWEMPSQAELQYPLEALVMFVGSQMDSGTNLVRIRAEFDNTTDPVRRLMPGTRVNLTVYPESAPKEQ